MASIGYRKAKDWCADFHGRGAVLWRRMAEIYGEDEGILEARRSLYLQALDTFRNAYGGDREVLISRAPARINLLGNHIDHRGGSLNYMAIDRDMVVVASPRDDDLVAAHNANAERFPSRAFGINELLPPGRRGDWQTFIDEVELTVGDWGNYIRAATLYLQDQFPDTPLKGMDLAVAGDVPVAAGLSSSSTLVVTALEATLACNDLEIPREEKAEFCGRAEWYVGTRGGSGDHAGMLYCGRNAILSVRFFPLEMEEVPFPEGYRVVACESFVEHHFPSIYNERVRTYDIGLMLVVSQFPQYAEKLHHLRDLTAGQLGVPLQEIYRIVKTLPERGTRREILDLLPLKRNELETLFSAHDEPEGGYRVRQAVLYGLGECARAGLCKELLRRGDIEGFGELKYLSHDGDRRVRYDDSGPATPVDNRVSGEAIDQLIADLDSGDPKRIASAQIHRQPGGYDCSCEELDFLVDTAARVEGVVGAGLTGGGLGGCVLVVAREDAVDGLLQILGSEYYEPRGLEDGTIVCASVAGAGLL